jgi:diketogulonate reductase-like aldo/keto reductase
MNDPSPKMQTKRIPASGEPLGVIGLGTYVGFDVRQGSGVTARLQQVLHKLFEAGGAVIDSSPMYGNAEAATGELLSASTTKAKPSEKTFLATKVWTRGEQAGIAQMNRSMQLLRTERLDLMQVHNLLDWRVHLKTMRGWKEAGRIRYLGVTHYTASAYADLEAVLRAEPLDFLQLNYSVMDRAAEQRLLPLALERRVAVLANLPLASGSALRAVAARPLPGVAGELACTSWAQLVLKFVISHPAVTCAIPGTSRGEHMAENAAAGIGPLADEAQRERIARAYEA